MRAVNADDLIHELDKCGIAEHGYVSVFGVPIIDDCVPVVRCKDCIHSRPDEYGLECMAHYRPTKEDDFCGYGEKVTE